MIDNGSVSSVVRRACRGFFQCGRIGRVLALSDSDWSRDRSRAARNAEPQPDAALHARARNLVEKVKPLRVLRRARRATPAARCASACSCRATTPGREKRFTGQTDWHIEWRACFEHERHGAAGSAASPPPSTSPTRCRSWADRDAAPAHLRERWDRYIVKLTAHEKGHGEIARRGRPVDRGGARRPHRSTSGCDTLNADAAAIVDEVMQRGEALQREYDRTTGHGTTQGAHFPF